MHVLSTFDSKDILFNRATKMYPYEFFTAIYKYTRKRNLYPSMFGLLHGLLIMVKDNMHISDKQISRCSTESSMKRFQTNNDEISIDIPQDT